MVPLSVAFKTLRLHRVSYGILDGFTDLCSTSMYFGLYLQVPIDRSRLRGTWTVKQNYDNVLREEVQGIFLHKLHLCEGIQDQGQPVVRT